MTTLEIILLSHLLVSQTLAGFVIFILPRRTRFNTFLFIILGILHPIIIIFSLINDLIEHIKNKK